MNIAVGTLLNNRYRITSVLGQGGMGAVYRAMDENLNVPVAVKENLFLTDEYSRQFQREANILASLRHHSLPSVRDYFTLPGVGQYLIMDFIEGEDLRQRIERLGTLPEEDTIKIGALICDALDHLHTRIPPVVHRDIKPGNIKITPDGDVVLVDFGLAKVMSHDQITTTGARAMTPGYSPPEQYGTARTDARSDIYSLGATLYASLTGIIPEDSLARATGKEKLTPLKQSRPKINRKLAEAIETALEIDPDDRYQSAMEMKQALLDSGGISVRFFDRNTVAPPPEDGEWQNPDEKRSPAPEDYPASFPPSRPRRKRTKLQPFYAAGILLLLSGIVTLAVLSQRFNFPTGTQRVNQLSGTPVYSSLTVTPADATDVPLPVIDPKESTQPIIASTPQETVPPETAQPTPTATPFGGGASQIAFSSNRTGSYQIWLMGADGRNQTQITNLAGGACQPNWSPDGKKLAFISPCTGRRDTYPGTSIYTANADGSDIQMLPIPPNPTGDFDPAWSPDGLRLAFTSLRNGRPHIYVYEFSSNLLTEISNSVFPDKQPAWSPSGKEIAFIRELPNGQVWKMGEDGSNETQFSPAGGINNLWPAWTKDGSSIFYSQTTVDNFNPWLIGLRYEDRKTSREFRIPPSGDTKIGPVVKADVSPDGMWLAYESWPLGVNHDIYIMTVTGARQTRLTSDPDIDFGPVWRPLAP